MRRRCPQPPLFTTSFRVLVTRGRGGDLTGTFSTLRPKWHRKCVPSRRNDRPRTRTKSRPASCIFRIREFANPPEKDLVLVKFPAPSPLNPCSPLTVHISARASAPRLADLRALAPIGARGHTSSRNYNSFRTDKLIPSRLASSEPVQLSKTPQEGKPRCVIPFLCIVA